MLVGGTVPIESLNNIELRNTAPLKGQSLNVSNIVTKPIDKVETIVNNAVDTFTPEIHDEEKKKSHKTAIRVGSTVLVIGGLMALLNPKFSSKHIEKIKTASAKMGTKVNSSDEFTGKLYKRAENILGRTAKILDFANNFNSAKDSFFKKLCTKKTNSQNKIWQKTDSIIVGTLKKPHELITRAFDFISKKTVYKNYEKVRIRANDLDDVIKQYRSKLPESAQGKLDELLKKLEKNKTYFADENIQLRLKEQEKIMSNLETDVVDKIKSYAAGFKDNPNKKQHIAKNLYFWAKEMLKPQKSKIESEGQKMVSKFIGDGKSKQGIYDEIVEIISPHISKEEDSVLKGYLDKFSKNLKAANKKECVEYFDKKRDLTLGSAPTDILSAIIGLGLSGVAISTADNKDERISKALTVAFPAIAGLGVSTTLTAFLYSGIKGMLYGSIASGCFSLLGNTINKTFVRHTDNKKG